eukprot:Opistho-2@80706
MAAPFTMDPGGVPVFRPTMEEFHDFSGYISRMEAAGAHEIGLAKVIPPDGWYPNRDYSAVGDLKISSPIQQIVTGRQGVYTQMNMVKRAMTVRDFEKLANSDRHKTPKHKDDDDLERIFWKNVTFIEPIYGADLPGSVFDPTVEDWNVDKLETILNTLSENAGGVRILGVNTAYLYFGMWKVRCACVQEEMQDELRAGFLTL